MTIALSTLVTNDDASPPVANDVGLSGGRVRSKKGIVTLATGDLDTGDIILLANLPTNAKVEGIWLNNTDLDTNATETIELDVGVFSSAGVAEAAAVYFDGSVDGAALFENANLDGINVFFRAVALGENELWEDAGDSTDPKGLKAVGVLVKIGAATAQAGTLGFLIHYTVD